MGDERGESVDVVVNILAAPIRTAATAITIAACFRVELFSANKKKHKIGSIGDGLCRRQNSCAKKPGRQCSKFVDIPKGLCRHKGLI
jgi:hypothetical protein